MIGIKDYTYQNIIFVHDFVFIFLIGVFWMIIAYFVIILYEYRPRNWLKYWKLFKIRKVMSRAILYRGFRHHNWVRKKNWAKLRRYEIKKFTWYWQYAFVFGRFKNLKIRKIWTTQKRALKKFGKYIKEVLRRTHNLRLEVVWTFIPIVIILELIFPSLSLIADDEISNKASLYTVNVIGNQWYWNYELNVVTNTIKQVSNLVLLDSVKDGEQRIKARKYRKFRNSRLLTTTNTVSIPVGLKTSFFISSNDVAHSWAIPGMGIKVDAIPGRINLKTVIASKIGLYSGMCSELCGIEHGFMPISLKVLTLNAWGYNLEYFSEKILNYNDIHNVWYI